MKTKFAVIFFFLIFIMVACGGDDINYYPKPNGYLRLDFPEREYTTFETDSCPYQFEMPDYFKVIDKGNCNKDIAMSRFNATLFLTYIPVDSNLMMNTEYSRKLVYDHSIKADAIEEYPLIDPSRKAYGIAYNIKGNAASPYQFYVTDSVNHFLRGALYFNVKPNYDSVRTSLEYIVEDIDNLLGTVTWE